MKILLFIFLILPALFSPKMALAGSFGQPYESQIQESVQKIQEGKDDPALLLKIIEVWKKKESDCKVIVQGDAWCSIQECDVLPEHCRKNRTLLFRGESKIHATPATSALWRSLRAGSSMGDQLDIFGIVKKLEMLRQELILDIKKNDPEFTETYNFRQSYFERHAEAQEPIVFADPVLNQEVKIDPLISFSISPTKAEAFSVMGAGQKHAKLIVLSVPKKNVKTLCPKALPKPGDLIETMDCADAMNEYSDEKEIDAFLYVKPEYIWKVFTNF